MDIKALLPDLKKWFEDYTHRFDSRNRVVQKSMDLKRDHTRRVFRPVYPVSCRYCIPDISLQSTGSLDDEGACVRMRGRHIRRPDPGLGPRQRPFLCRTCPGPGRVRRRLFFPVS